MKRIILFCSIISILYLSVELYIIIDLYMHLDEWHLNEYTLRNLLHILFIAVVSIFFLNIYKKK